MQSCSLPEILYKSMYEETELYVNGTFGQAVMQADASMKTGCLFPSAVHPQIAMTGNT